MEISEEVKRLYKAALVARLQDETIKLLPDDNRYKQSVILADALRDALARALKAENKIQHDRHYINGRSHLCGGISTGKDCARKEWTDADWQAEAHRRLMGESK